MNKLEMRLSKLEQKTSDTNLEFVMLVLPVKAGEARELTKIHAAKGGFSCMRGEGELKDEFIARAELEAKECIRPVANSATLLIGSLT